VFHIAYGMRCIAIHQITQERMNHVG